MTKSTSVHYLHNRVLKINVGFLLVGGSSITHDSMLDFPTIQVADDLIVDYLRGPLRLSRTKEGVLVQTQLQAAVAGECYRCLDPLAHEVEVDLEELYAFQGNRQAEFWVDDDNTIDLGPVLRAEIMIELEHRVLCRPDCKGLCQECGANLNYQPCQCHLDNIDPRLAALRKLLDANG